MTDPKANLPASVAARLLRRAKETGDIYRVASQTGTLAGLDLPALIYATRNWNVHGVLLSSSFRGTRKKFEAYINTVTQGLARILEGAATHLLSCI